MIGNLGQLSQSAVNDLARGPQKPGEGCEKVCPSLGTPLGSEEWRAVDTPSSRCVSRDDLGHGGRTPKNLPPNDRVNQRGRMCCAQQSFSLFFCSRSRPGERTHRGAGGIDWSGKDSHQHRDQSLGPADRTILENRLGVVGQAAAGGSVRPSRMFVQTGVRLRWTAGEMWLAGEWLNRWSVSSFSQNSSAGRTPPADSSR